MFTCDIVLSFELPFSCFFFRHVRQLLRCRRENETSIVLVDLVLDRRRRRRRRSTAVRYVVPRKSLSYCSSRTDHPKMSIHFAMHADLVNKDLAGLAVGNCGEKVFFFLFLFFVLTDGILSHWRHLLDSEADPKCCRGIFYFFFQRLNSHSSVTPSDRMDLVDGEKIVSQRES